MSDCCHLPWQNTSQLSESLMPPKGASCPHHCSRLGDPLAESQRSLYSLVGITSCLWLWCSHVFCSPPWTSSIFRAGPLHVRVGIATLSKSHSLLRQRDCDWTCVGRNRVSHRESSRVPQTGPASERSLRPTFLVSEPPPRWLWFLLQPLLSTLTSHLLAGWASLPQGAALWIWIPSLTLIYLWFQG